MDVNQYNLIKLNADIIDIKARVQALENVFFGWYNSEHSEEQSKEYKKMFLEFFYENIDSSIKQLPDGLVKEITESLLKNDETGK